MKPPARFPNEFRSMDGSGNNPYHPDRGQAQTGFRRMLPARYDDGVDFPAGLRRPSARAVSNAIAAARPPAPSPGGPFTDIFWQWGQFVEHDLYLTPTTANPFYIAVPLGDPHLDPARTGVYVIPFFRSTPAPTTFLGPREQLNAVTTYLDGSQVYGSDEKRALELRTLDGTGRLRTSAGDLLPVDDTGSFVAGDIRVNEHAGLICMHTVFLREHNTWADRIREDHPELSDEQIYQRARAIVGAEIQAITYEEFLPLLLGREAYREYLCGGQLYNPVEDPGILNEFATAACRWVHSMLPSTLLRLGADGRPISQGNISLASAFFNPDAVREVGIEPYLRGMAAQRAKEIDNQVVDEARNFLSGPPGAGGFDLASFNIQRGRDHGLPSYSQMRTTLGLQPVASFRHVPRDVSPAVWAKLASVYNSVDDIDLWVGGLAEVHVPGAMVGATFLRIMGAQFQSLRYGDRFWYEGYLPPDLVQMVREQTLSRIIQRNTSIGFELQPNVFLVR